MIDSYATPAREFSKGIGEAVAARTIVRKINKFTGDIEQVPFEVSRRDDMALDQEVAAFAKNAGYIISGYTVDSGDDLIVRGTMNVVGNIESEKWADVAHRVALGNSLLDPRGATLQEAEFHHMNHHLRQASILMSGRHLQHGDKDQKNRPGEVFTNCSSSASTFITFYLLLSGSGVGRSYDDAMMLVDYGNLPIVAPVIDFMHPDVQSGEISALDRRTAEHLYAGRQIHVFEVPDSREGWAKAFEKMEVMAFQRIYRDDVLLLDFSKVRPKGSPIMGMQGRPASGPGALMNAIKNIAQLRDAGMEAWRSTMYADHYASECVLVGGARRAARMAMKHWKDRSVLDFIQVKRGGFLWSSNNSVAVDAEFWSYVKGEIPEGMIDIDCELADHAKAVFDAICQAAYHDGTGEPGFINQDKLTKYDDGIEALFDGDYAGSNKYQLEDATKELTAAIAKAWVADGCKMAVNPCGEIPISAIGAYCTIADVVPYHAGYSVGLEGVTLDAWDADAEDAFRVATRALIRTNLMNFLYDKEVKRTNRIGVGFTGLHEYAWTRFGYGWKDIIDEEKSKDFWLMMSRFSRAVSDEAIQCSAELGVVVPHTSKTCKPAGTTSKLFSLTEGAHLPSMREYLRWVQFRNDDPLVAEYEAQGYPVRKLRTYSGTTIVGFPTRPEICTLGMGDKLVTAAEATPEEQYQYLRLLEKYWLTGVEEDGVTPLRERGGQISYTLKYNPTMVSFEDFKNAMLMQQSTVRCCSVMPQTDSSAYEYQPEESVSRHDYEQICKVVEASASEIKQDIGLEHVGCAGGACPVDFRTEASAANAPILDAAKIA